MKINIQELEINTQKNNNNSCMRNMYKIRIKFALSQIDTHTHAHT